MKIRVISCLLAGVLSLSLLLGACSQKPGETKKGPAVTLSDKEVVTMEKAADYLSYTAADYNKEVPGKKELLTMASRAFRELPKPVGNNARLAPFDVDLSGVPQWALDDIKKLKEAGILVQNDLGITAKPMENRTDGKMEDADRGFRYGQRCRQPIGQRERQRVRTFGRKGSSFAGKRLPFPFPED